MKRKSPSISVVTASYTGSLSSLNKCLKLVRGQNYPQKNIEIVIGHGGKESEIKPIAKKFNARYKLIPEEKQNAEYNRGVAFNMAKNELILILDHDNYMPTRNFLREYVKPLIEHKEVVAVESCYYHYDKNLSIMDRYFALFGVLDPIPYYFGKADRMKWTSKTWNLLGEVKDRGDYYLVKFDKDPRNIPTVGTNGCLMRRKLVVSVADIKPESHYPIDVMVDVIKSGHNVFAFTKNSLIHETGSRGFIPFLKRRLKFMTQYHFEDLSKRRYSVYISGDFWKLVKYCLYSITVVVPLTESIIGFIKVPDVAWFLHPFMCLGMLSVYTWGTLASKLRTLTMKQTAQTR